MNSLIYEVSQIGKGTLFVMAKPITGEWVNEEFENIRKNGIDIIVSLLEASEAYELGLVEESAYAENNNMEFRNYPIPDRGIPSVPETYLKFTKEIYSLITNGKNVAIHCRAGIGRTGLVAGTILMYHGNSCRSALDLISKARGVTVPDTPEQELWLQELTL